MALTPYTKAPQELPTTQDFSSEIDRGFQLHRQKEQQDYERKEKKDAEFMQMAKTDPLLSSNLKLQERYNDQQKAFIDSAAKIFYNSDHNPTIQDKLQIQQMKIALNAFKQKSDAEQQKVNELIKTRQKDPDGKKFDTEYMGKVVNDWDNGKIQAIPQDIYRAAPIKDTDEYLRDLKLAPYKKSSMTQVINGKPFTKDYEERYSNYDPKTGKLVENPEVAYNASKNLYLNDSKYERKANEEWLSASPETQQEYNNKYPDTKDPLSKISAFMFDKHKDAFFNINKEDLKQDKPTKDKKGDESPSEYSTGENSIKTPVSWTGLNPSERKEYDSLVDKPDKKPEEKKRVEQLATWSRDKKRSGDTFIPHYDSVHVPIAKAFSIDNNNVFDASTGERVDDKGHTIFKNAEISWVPYNESKGKLDVGGVEHGSRNALNTGWKLVPVLVGKDSDDGQDMNYKILNAKDIYNISKETRGVVNAKNVPLEKGTQAKQGKEIDINKLKNHTYSGMSYDEAFKKLKAKGMTDEEINQKLSGKL